MQQLGQITDNKIHKDQKTPTATSEELGAKTGCTLAHGRRSLVGKSHGQRSLVGCSPWGR